MKLNSKNQFADRIYKLILILFYYYPFLQLFLTPSPVGTSPLKGKPIHASLGVNFEKALNYAMDFLPLKRGDVDRQRGRAIGINACCHFSFKKNK